jgi:hypothetical protein
MADPDLTPIEELQRSLGSLDQLRQSALASMLLMVVGAVIVVGALVYSVTQLRPLEQQVAAKQGEVFELEETARVLLQRKDSLLQESDVAQAQLDTARLVITRTLTELRQIEAMALPPSARASVGDALRRTQAIERQISRTASRPGARPTNPGLMPSAIPTDTLITTGGPSLSPATAGPGLQATVVDLFSERAPDRLRAYDHLIVEYGRDPALIPSLLTHARENRSNLNGIYNALVVLNSVDRTLLTPHVQEIRDFAQGVQSLGPRIRTRAQEVLGRLPG